MKKYTLCSRAKGLGGMGLVEIDEDRALHLIETSNPKLLINGKGGKKFRLKLNKMDEFPGEVLTEVFLYEEW